MNSPIKLPARRPRSTAGALLLLGLLAVALTFTALALSGCASRPASWRVLRSQNDRIRAVDRYNDRCGEDAKAKGVKLPKATCVAAKAELDSWDTDEGRSVEALKRSGCADLKAACTISVGLVRGQIKDIESHRRRMPRGIR